MKTRPLLPVFVTCLMWVVSCSSAPRSTQDLAADANAPAEGATGPSAPTATNDPEPTTEALAPVCVTQGAYDVNVVITSKAGPNQAAPRPIDNRLWSMNIDDRLSSDYTPSPTPKFTELLKALRPGLLRWPSGNHAQSLIFSTTNTGRSYLTPALIDGFMGLCKAVGAKPVLGVNIETGTPEQAAALVTYVNKTKGYDVQWFQIGNEPDLKGVTATSSPAIYAATYQKFTAAMRAVDSSIKFVGAEIMTGTELFGSNGQTPWLMPILQNTAQSPMDAIAWHYYPLDSSQTSSKSSATLSIAHALQESATDWLPAGMNYPQIIFPQLISARQSLAPRAQLWVDEIAEDSGVKGGSGVSDRNVGALWTAENLLRFADQGADALFRFIFKDEDKNAYCLLNSDNAPSPAYAAYWLLAQHYGDALVKTTSDQVSQVGAHAATLGSDGSLRVVLVNKTNSAKKVRLKLNDFTPKRAGLFTLVGSDLAASDLAINGASVSAATITANPAAKAVTDSCSDNIITLPAASISLYVLGAK